MQNYRREFLIAMAAFGAGTALTILFPALALLGGIAFLATAFYLFRDGITL